MHKNPVSKKWQLVNDFTDYLYSSASYYEKGIKQYDKLLHVNEVLLRSIMLHSSYRIPGSALLIQSRCGCLGARPRGGRKYWNRNQGEGIMASVMHMN